ncbi:glycosyltransferase [Candidatus Gottesmanbacteria bacterium]|nr:glycosyltransferase [Candidatus Gottesmanbacteria bacterium]
MKKNSNPAVSFYDKHSRRRDWFFHLNRYYNNDLIKYYRFLVPEGSSVLEVGCGTGHLLASLKPKIGMGIDISPGMIRSAKQKYPKLKFRLMDAQHLQMKDKFDYIIISGLIGDLDDIEEFFRKLAKVTHQRSRIIIDNYNYFWHYILRLAEIMHLKTPQIYKNWLPASAIENMLYLADFEVIRRSKRMLFPLYIPMISEILNRFIAKLPWVKNLCLNNILVAKPVSRLGGRKYSCSVIMPARNEKGTIEDAIRRIPEMGSGTEIVMIEDHSTDKTREEMHRVIKKFPKKNIELLIQDKEKGKKLAVYRGCEAAKSDILMILDADLSVIPEDLPRFYQALVDGKGEMISGSRLTYPMENNSMRLLNLLGNYFFGVLFTWLLEHKVTDTLCGTKVFWRSDYQKIKKMRSYFGDFDPFGDFDLLFGASKLHLKSIEIPIRYKARVYGKTNIKRVRNAIVLLWVSWNAFWKMKAI